MHPFIHPLPNHHFIILHIDNHQHTHTHIFLEYAVSCTNFVAGRSWSPKPSPTRRTKCESDRPFFRRQQGNEKHDGCMYLVYSCLFLFHMLQCQYMVVDWCLRCVSKKKELTGKGFYRQIPGKPLEGSQATGIDVFNRKTLVSGFGCIS